MRNKKGFTLAELMVVVAIIGVLVAVSVPIFNSQLEKSREATDLANVRSAYAQVMTEAVANDTPDSISVKLKQKKNDWQTKLPITLGGVTYNGTATANWIGTPKANGSCVVSYDKVKGIVYNWNGTYAGDISTIMNSYLKPKYSTRNEGDMNNNKAFFSNLKFTVDGKEVEARVYYADSPPFQEALTQWKLKPSSYADGPFAAVENKYPSTNKSQGFAYYTYGNDGSINNFIYVNDKKVYQTTDEGKTWYDITLSKTSSTP